jgi:hypothetical protein
MDASSLHKNTLSDLPRLIVGVKIEDDLVKGIFLSYKEGHKSIYRTRLAHVLSITNHLLTLFKVGNTIHQLLARWSIPMIL